MTDLAPGRELDALVAEKVMGQKVKSADDLGGLYSVESDFFVNPPDRGEPVYAHTLPLPHYSTDIKAAWVVVEKIRELGRDFTIQQMDRLERGKWCVRSDRPDAHTGAPIEVWTTADTAPHAICLAALESVQ